MGTAADTRPRRPPLAVALGLAAVLLACSGGTPCAAREPGRKLVFEGRSDFNQKVFVFDEGDLRVLRFSKHGVRQSSMRRGDPSELVHLYLRALNAGLALVDGQQRDLRVLVVGLGGGTYPMFLRRYFPKVHVEVVDIDPAVVDAARKFFDLREDDHLKVRVGDGRAFIERAEAKWDMIVLDAFGPKSIPMALATVEFLRAVRDHLRPGGVCVANVWGPRANDLFDAMMATYRAVFAELHLVGVPSGSVAAIALPDARGLDDAHIVERADSLGLAHALPFDLRELVTAGLARAPKPGPAEPLRDPPAARPAP